MTESTNEQVTTEEFRVNGEELLKTIKEIIAKGNARSITIKNESGEELIKIPLTFAVVGAVIAPVLVAVGALAALVTKCVIVVERKV